MSPGCYDQYNDETLSSTLSANVHCYSLPFCRVLNARQDSSNCFLFFLPKSLVRVRPVSRKCVGRADQSATCLCALYLSQCSILVCVCFVLVCIRCHCLYEFKVYVCLCSFACLIQYICMHRVFSLVSYSSSLYVLF